MTRVLIAGRFKDGDVTDSIRFLKILHEVNAVGTIAAASSESEASAYADAFDALLLTGGADINPARYGQQPSPANLYDGSERDLSDELLLKAFISVGKKALGVCRGCQAINVFLGGTLHQHLPDTFSPVLWHARNMTGRHPAQVVEGTILARLLGAGEIRVNSSHHQAIDRLGKGLTVSAAAPDGVTEAAEGKNLLLIQWHPEYMDSEHASLFRWLVKS